MYKIKYKAQSKNKIQKKYRMQLKKETFEAAFLFVSAVMFEFQYIQGKGLRKNIVGGEIL